jgi:hypothetical protein
MTLRVRMGKSFHAVIHIYFSLNHTQMISVYSVFLTAKKMLGLQPGEF